MLTRLGLPNVTLKEVVISALIISGNFPPPPVELPSFYMQQKQTTFTPPVPPQLHPPLEPLATTFSCTMTNPETPSMTSPPLPPSAFPFPPSTFTLPSTQLLTSSTSMVPPSPPYSLMSSSTVPAVEQSPVVDPPESHAAATATDIPITVNQTISSTPIPPPIVTSSAQMMIPMNGQETEQTVSKINDESKRMGMLHWFQQTVQQSEFLSKMANKAKVC